MNGEEIKKDGNFRLDLGCGNSKKEGTIGIDIEKADGVDYVLVYKISLYPFQIKVLSIFIHHIFWSILIILDKYFKKSAELQKMERN
jgi:hypothetical protein